LVGEGKGQENGKKRWTGSDPGPIAPPPRPREETEQIGGKKILAPTEKRPTGRYVKKNGDGKI